MAAQGMQISRAPRQDAMQSAGIVRTRRRLQRRRSLALAFGAACPMLLLPMIAAAYTAVGDRLFPATVLLPQAAPTDAVYVTPSTQPVSGGNATNLTATFDKLLTERLGIGIQNGYNWIGRTDASTLVGWQNLLAYVKYEAILDPPHEFLFSIGTAHEFGGTGTRRIDAPRNGATLVPTTFFAKGFGDLPIDYLRPLAVQGFATYQLSSGPPRPDFFLGGLALEYSIPYLQSKVRAFDLPDLVRGLTPLVETLVVTPTRNRGGATTAVIVAPGVAYTGEGWQFAIEARVPATRAAGSGAGVLAQFNVQLDYFFPDAIGKPLFSWR
jgi:hypothetical protein